MKLVDLIIYHPRVQKFQAVEVSTSDPRTVLLMLDSPEPVIVCKACEAIHKFIDKCELFDQKHLFVYNFLIADANCIELNNLGVVCPLVKLLSSPDRAVRSFTVICLASMARNGRNLFLFVYCVILCV